MFWVLKRTIGSFEYPQHMFWLRNMKNYFLVGTLIWRPDISNAFGEKTDDLGYCSKTLLCVFDKRN